MWASFVLLYLANLILLNMMNATKLLFIDIVQGYNVERCPMTCSHFFYKSIMKYTKRICVHSAHQIPSAFQESLFCEMSQCFNLQ